MLYTKEERKILKRFCRGDEYDDFLYCHREFSSYFSYLRRNGFLHKYLPDRLYDIFEFYEKCLRLTMELSDMSFSSNLIMYELETSFEFTSIYWREENEESFLFRVYYNYLKICTNQLVNMSMVDLLKSFVHEIELRQSRSYVDSYEKMINMKFYDLVDRICEFI